MSTSIFELNEKIALVMGGSRGLGRSIALAYANAGADVIVSSRKLDACQAVVDEINDIPGRKGLAVACHLGNWSEIEDLVETTYARFGKIDVLVNNAGMSPLYDDLASLTEELFDKVLAVNLKGPFRLAALTGKRMVEAGHGSIINVSSSGGTRHPRPHIVPYSAAKAGVNAMTSAMALAYGPAVRVNCILPGPFLTDVSKAWDMESQQKKWNTFALKRAGSPDEIVGAALYFASDASSFTTGSFLAVDGGEP